jgi:3-deoxy-D-manno-octulosonic-acid transferase
MRLLYNILFPIFFLITAPFYFWKMVRRGNWIEGFTQRFGVYGELREELRGERVLWLHAVSVGEANLAVQLVEVLRKEFGDWRYVVSTTTTTGMGVLRSKLPDSARAIYYPIDWLPFVKSAFRTLRPSAIVLVEAEIWPNLFWEANRTKAPLSLVNARLSEKSFEGYRRFGFLFRPLFESLKMVGVHNEIDAERMERLGSAREIIHVVGNMKFDGSSVLGKSELDASALLAQLRVPKDAQVLVAGSTFEGEEALLCELLLRWREAYPSLFLVLVPRHFERAKAVMELLDSTRLKIARRSQLESAPENPDVLLVDTTGELNAFYEVATLVFIGKSLTAQGGQNPIEPATLGKPIIFGPFMQNFREVVASLLDAKGAVQVANEAELEDKINELLGDSEHCAALASAAMSVVEANKGATQRTAQLVGQTLRSLE